MNVRLLSQSERWRVIIQRGAFMSAPSRRPEIRRRRTRKEKINKLQKRLAAAGSGADRTRIESKIDRMGRTSPGQPLAKA
jgi:hypothetical protein